METRLVVLSFVTSILTNIIVCLGTLAMFNWVSSSAQSKFVIRYRVPVQIVLGSIYLFYLCFLSWSTTLLDTHAFGMHWTYLNMIIVGMYMLALIIRSKKITALYVVLGILYYLVGVRTVKPIGIIALALGMLIIGVIHRYAPILFGHRIVVYGGLLLFAVCMIVMVDSMATYQLDVWFWVRQWVALLILAVVSVEYNYSLTRQRQHEKAIEYEAHHDGLTGLRNFTSFTEDLEEIHDNYLATEEAYTLLEFDTDHFKRINDRFGHPAGNTVLRAVSGATHDFAARLEYNAHAYRVGGEEFAMILHHKLSAADEAILSHDLRGRIRDLRFNGVMEPVRLTISVGVAPVTADDTNYLSIYTAADAYLYRVKQNGRNGAAVRGQIIH
ncbi:GGDEF domain-containing protein [Lacticaseibacillus pabuli]|uniref:GGDEF domain-containing protein n=1 Tax=Lacticaseibacillus pabuli TaxID=3025672 RepID=A0ABY7WRR0_9LACO|nr:GGDEF domain-containing protein [Lacticaseibacillus sp. KACC 23028]WDF82801.1 GGDEF domain-containing protein [Lacticaseibacillus sp. KACC 23028]